VKTKYINLYIISATAFLLAIIFYLVSWFGYYIPKYNYQVGQIATSSVKAPFDFRVLKSNNMIEVEVAIAMSNLPPIYTISEEINFDILRKIDSFFIIINNMPNKADIVNVSHIMIERGYQFDDHLLVYLLNNTNRIYEIFTSRFAQLMNLPIVEDIDKNKVFRMIDSQKLAESLQSSMITKTEAKSRLVSGLNNPLMREVILNLADKFLISNLIIDIEAQKTERENRKRSIDPVFSRIEQNELIISKNERITDIDILKFESLNRVLAEELNQRNYREILGQFLYNLLIFSLFYYMIKGFFKCKFVSRNELIITYSIFLLSILITVFLYYIIQIKNIILIPIPLFILTLSILFNRRFGIMFSLFLLIVTGQYIHWNMLPLMNLVVASLVCLLIFKKPSQINYLLVFFSLLSGLIVTSVITFIFRNERLTDLILNLSYCLLNASISSLGVYFLIPYLQKKLKYATKEVLLSLIDNNNPLLKKLAREAPGTYYHSLTVGVLAEECAEAISANPMIARIGSYYHDIGKLENPDYFIENVKTDNPHDVLSPSESAAILKNHVKTGVMLAKLEKLPGAIIDIIEQHHGNTKTRYFYHKAKELGLDINDDDFEYRGPKPQTKEAVIVMIVDIIESTVKSAKFIDEDTIKEIIDDAINNLLEDNQLIDSPITLKELHMIKTIILPILCSIHRRRIEYPNEK